MAGTGPNPEPSVIGLIRDAVRDFSVIVKGEIALATAELKRQAAAGATGGFLIFIVIILLSMTGLFASVALALGFYAMGLSLWLSFLIVAGIYLLFSIVLVLIAIVAFRKIKGPQTASRVAAQTRAYLQAALAPVKEDDPDAADAVAAPDASTPAEPETPARPVTLPARVPSAQPTPPTGSGPEQKPTA